MARNKKLEAPDSVGLFIPNEERAVAPPASTVRVFVTNDELRTCLSHDAVVPWLDAASENPVPHRLVAFDGPVDPTTLDSLRPRGPNTFWIGLELDAVERPNTSELPAAIDAVVPMSSVKRIVFGNSAEHGQFEATRLANVHLPNELVAVDEEWFKPSGSEASPTDPPVTLLEATSADTMARVDRFRRLHGAAVAAMGWTKEPDALDPFLLGLVHQRSAPSTDFRSWTGRLISNVLIAHGLGGEEPAAEAWALATGSQVIPQPSPLSRVDHTVRAAVVAHLMTEHTPTLDRTALVDTILAAAAEAGRDDALTATAERYPKAVDVGRAIWRSLTTWERLLEKWPDGFPTLLAVLVMGSVHDADQYEILAERARNLTLPNGVSRLALALYGMRWGIEAVPTKHRATSEKRRLSETLAWRAADRDPEAPPAAPLKASWALERVAGRAASRPYALRLDVLDQRFEWAVEPTAVFTAKLRRALEKTPDSLQKELLPLATGLTWSRPFLGWTVRLPKSGAVIELNRGRAVLTGPLSDGEPTIEWRWTDWEAFAKTLTRHDAPLGELTRSSDLISWERVFEKLDTEEQGSP